MTAATETQVRQARNLQEAMIVIARALDRIEAAPAPTGWQSDWRVGAAAEAILAEPERFGPAALATAQEVVDELHTQITGDEVHTEVVIPPVNEERKEQRRMFERQQLKLAEFLQDDSEDWTEQYAKGGPRWLYYANRDLVMSLPDDARRMMVEDVELDSPTEAQEIARDILKFRGETGPTSVAMGTDVLARPGDRVR